MVFRTRHLGCTTKGNRVVKAKSFLSRAYRRNTLILSFPDENRSDINVLNNTMRSIGMGRDKTSGFSPTQRFWVDGPENKKTTEETSEDFSSLESLLNPNPIKP